MILTFCRIELTTPAGLATVIADAEQLASAAKAAASITVLIAFTSVGSDNSETIIYLLPGKESLK